MSWHENLDAVWDGESLLLLGCFPAMRSQHPANATQRLSVYSRPDAAGAFDLVGVVEAARAGAWIRPVRIPPSHRSIRITNSEASDKPLEVELNTSDGWPDETDWRLVLQFVSDDIPDFVGSRRTRTKVGDFRKFLEQRVGELTSDEAAVTWATSWLERRTTRGATALLEIGPSRLVYPEGIQSAPIEVYRRPHQPFRPQASQNDEVGLPAIWRFKESEAAPSWSIEIRTSSTDGTAIAAQARTAIVHVRSQQRYFFKSSEKRKLNGEPEIVALRREDIVAAMPDEDIGLPPDGDAEDNPGICAVNLGRALAKPGDLSHGIIVSQLSDQGVAVITFDNAALGDDIGLVSTRPASLRRRAPDQQNASDIAMFRVQPAELEPRDVGPTDPIREELRSAAADTEGSAARADAPPADSALMKARIAAATALAAWLPDDERFRPGSYSVSLFEGLEPLVCAGFIDMLQGTRLPVTELQANLAAYRADPALCVAVIREERLRQNFFESHSTSTFDQSPNLLVRLMRAIGMPSDASANSDPKWQIDAFALLRESKTTRDLVAARIYIDGAADVSRAKITTVLRELSDSAKLAGIATRLMQRAGAKPSNATDATFITDYLRTKDVQGWLPLSEAAVLAGIVQREGERPRPSLFPAPPLPEPAIKGGDVAEIRAGIERLAQQLSPHRRAIYQAIDLQDCDEEDLLSIEQWLKREIHGPERDRLAQKTLKTLEAWAEVPEFLEDISARFREPDDADEARSPVVVADRFRDRTNLERSGILKPIPRGEFATYLEKTRAAVKAGMSDDGSSSEINETVLPMADVFFYHNAFRTIQKVLRAAEQQLGPNATRQLRHRLSRWPRNADVCWTLAKSIDATIPAASKVDMDAMMRPPDFS